MGTLDRSVKKSTLVASIMAAMGKAFGPNKPKKIHRQGQTKRYRYRWAETHQNPAGTKLRRSIRRGNFGVVNKHGTIGAAIAEKQREIWLFDHSKPYIKLSTSI